MKKFMDQPLFVPQYNISVDAERQLALKRLKAICSQGFFSVRDFRTNPDKIFAAHELAGYADGALATKMTVQFNLFGGSQHYSTAHKASMRARPRGPNASAHSNHPVFLAVLKLGTDKHHGKFLDQIDRAEQIGCFGLTELG